MGITLMSLESNTADDKPETLSSWIKNQPNIVIDPGINWGDVYFLTEEQKDKFLELYKKRNSAPRFHVQSRKGLVGYHLSAIIRIRKWLKDDNCLPGKEEKAQLISAIEQAQATGEHTGIHPSAYPELLARLYSIPDTEDLLTYSVHYYPY